MNLLTNQEATIQNIQSIEGEHWMETQSDAHGFNVREALDQLASPRKSEEPDDVVCQIYGRNGRNRYFVLTNGDVVFSRGQSRPEDVDQAEALGFRVV